jgi:hypothetical protein
MKQADLEKLLMLEVHRLVVEAARSAVAKLGKAVPAAARAGYITDEDITALKATTAVDFDNPVVRKAMVATIARNQILSYPPDGRITEQDAAALEQLRLTVDQRTVLERVVSEACHAAFFNFFCLLDAVGDPELTKLKSWGGARFEYRRKEGPMLHDEIGGLYDEFRKKVEG